MFEQPLRTSGRLAIRSAPELYLVALAFFLNIVWEMWQIVFFESMAAMPHWEGVKRCTRAAVGDVAIAVAAFSVSSASAGSRQWFVAPSRRDVVLFVGAGLIVTVVIEKLATGMLNLWEYSSLMPVVPRIEVGVIPLLQWLVLPLIELTVLRQLALGRRLARTEAVASMDERVDRPKNNETAES